MNNEITRTLVGGELQTAQYRGLKYAIRPNTTLNQVLGINEDEFEFAPNEYPHTRAFVIGSGGHRYTAGPDGEPAPSALKHRPTDAALYRQMPFVLRREDNDLPPEQRARYGLRKLIVHEGIRYFAYYARIIDDTNTVTELQKLITRDGETKVIPYEYTSENLKPKPPVITPDRVVPSLSDSDEVAVAAVTTIQFTEVDIAEYLNAVKILRGEERYAVISEIATVSYVPRRVTTAGPGGTQIQMEEMFGAQITSFVTSYQNLAFSTTAFGLTIDCGVSEPLLTESGAA